MRPADITAAINAFKEAVKGNTVSPQEIERRMRICRLCPKLRKVSGLTGRISQLMGQLSAKHKVPTDLSDRSCACCGCSLLLLIPATEENLHKDSPRERARRPGQCWLKNLPSKKST